MTEAEQHIAAFNRGRAGHLWSTAVRLQREVLELREEKAELVAVLKEVYEDRSWRLDAKVRLLIAKAEEKG